VSLESCLQLDPQTSIAMVSRLDVSPAEIPGWRRIPPGGILTVSRSEIEGLLRAGRGAHIEEHALLDGQPYWRYAGSAGDLPPHLRRDQAHASN